MTKLLLGTVAHNPHVQNMARALCDADLLSMYATGGVDVFHGAALRAARRCVAASAPSLNRELQRRRITSVPADLVRARWRWELPRVVANRFRLGERLVDFLWERGELDLDRACARMISGSHVGFLGVEHGALAALTAARKRGTPAVVAFLSPHHLTLDRWVEPEYDRFPELRTPARAALRALDGPRNHRRDQEAAVADWIVTNSSFTTRSLVDAGVAAAKILTVPLGGPAPIGADELPARKPSTITFVYAGPATVRKGAHHLLRAWKGVAGPGAELHFYGGVELPDSVRREAEQGAGGSSVVFHGSVPAVELSRVYRDASVLVLPTLCDGFGMVVSEALAHGLPVITTRNAGASDAVAHGRTGFIVPPADVEALSASLSWCVEHGDELFAMRRDALAAAAKWTWTDYRRRFIRLLTGVMAASPMDAPGPAVAAVH